MNPSVSQQGASGDETAVTTVRVCLLTLGLAGGVPRVVSDGCGNSCWRSGLSCNVGCSVAVRMPLVMSV